MAPPAMLGAAVPKGFKLTHDASVSLVTVLEDDHLIGICKPAGVPAHPSPGTWDGGTLAHALVGRVPAAMLEERGNHDETDSFIPKCIVHRLDAGTSGVMVIAKTPLAVRRLTDQMRTADAPSAPSSSAVGSKVYVALLMGHPGGAKRETFVTIDGAIGRDPDNPREWCVTPTGKHAKTVVRVHAYDEKSGVALVTAELFSGRTHQIRVHCAHVGAPVASDGLYASKAANDSFRRFVGKALPSKRQLLHAWALNLLHPARLGPGKQLAIRAPLPQDLGNVVEKLFPKMGLDPSRWPGVPERLASGKTVSVDLGAAPEPLQQTHTTCKDMWSAEASAQARAVEVPELPPKLSPPNDTRSGMGSVSASCPSGMRFWGGVLEPGGELTNFPSGALLRVSQACIAPDAAEGASARLLLESSGQAYALARLRADSSPRCVLDMFLDASRAKFIVKGKAAVHLTGYFEPDISAINKKHGRSARAKPNGKVKPTGSQAKAAPAEKAEKDQARPPKRRRVQ